MGQISLPRLHKLNNGVFFESSYLLKTEMWQSIKLYLFLSNFATIFQFESLLSYKYSWSSVSYFSFVNFNISKKKIYSAMPLSTTLEKTLFSGSPLLLNFYLTYISGKYYTILFMWPITIVEVENSFLETTSTVLPLNTLLYV